MNSLPVFQVTDSSIVMYQEPLNRKLRSALQRDSESNLRDLTYNGYMSKKTRSKVKKYLSVWLNGIQLNRKYYKKRHQKEVVYPTFITLTLPSTQLQKDNHIKRELLNPFIIWMQQKHNVAYYYWRAEPQKNGNIHFHIIADKYIHHTNIRKQWNKYLDKLGYLDSYSTRMKLLSLQQYFNLVKHRKDMTFEKAKKHYLREKKSGWLNPNSTDVKSLKGIKSISAYVIKYMTKTEGSRKIEGRIHGGSEQLKSIKPYQELAGQAEFAICSELEKDPKVKKVYGEFHTVYYLDTHWYLQRLNFKYYSKLMSFYNQQFDLLYRGEQPRHPPDQRPPTIIQKVENKIQLNLFKKQN